ncbi:ELAV-like protein 1-B [Nymphon striatum]|nr:ELAV-like protein 1-B [Nymphon striatum]
MSLLSLLSVDTCLELGLLTVKQGWINLVTTLEIEVMLNSYKDVFGGLGRLPSEYQIKIDKEATSYENKPQSQNEFGMTCFYKGFLHDSSKISQDVLAMDDTESQKAKTEVMCQLSSNVAMEPDGKTNLIINYLPQTMTDQQFKAMFQNIGPLKSCKVIRHQPTNYSFGYGFADFVNEPDALKAIEQLDGLQLASKKLKVAYARPSSERIKNANVYVRGVPKTMTKDDVQAAFTEFGDIIQCRVLGNEGEDASFTGMATKGTAFVLFNTNEEAELAIAKMTGQTLPGGTEPLSVKFAEDNNKKVRPPQNMGNANQIPRFPNYSNMPGMRNPGYNGGYGNQNMFNNYGGGYGGGPMRSVNGSQNRYNPMNSGLSENMQGPGYILFVYNIGQFTDEKSLWSLFAQYGTVSKVNIIRDSATGAGKGYGFVTMPVHQEACWAIENCNGFKMNGRSLQVSFKTQKPM